MLAELQLEGKNLKIESVRIIDNAHGSYEVHLLTKTDVCVITMTWGTYYQFYRSMLYKGVEEAVRALLTNSPNTYELEFNPRLTTDELLLNLHIIGITSRTTTDGKLYCIYTVKYKSKKLRIPVEVRLVDISRNKPSKALTLLPTLSNLIYHSISHGTPNIREPLKDDVLRLRYEFKQSDYSNSTLQSYLVRKLIGRDMRNFIQSYRGYKQGV